MKTSDTKFSLPLGNVLIVDDEPSARATLAALLEDDSFKLAFAVNGPEALACAPGFDPDVILLDVMMPGQDGFETCRRLRAHAQLAEVPILMVTAMDDQRSKLQALEAGADGFLTKPLDRLELTTRLRAITRLNRHRRLKEAREKFERLVNLSPDGVLLVDGSGIVRFTNPALHTMLGFGANTALIGKNVFSLIAREQLPHCQQCFASIVNDSATALRVETLFLRADGARISVEINAGYLTWDGQPTVQLVVRDVTERKRLEAELFRAQRLETIGLLAGGIAHDLNNILAPILMSVELLRQNPALDETTDRMLQMISRSAQRGAALVDQVLVFARGVNHGHGEVLLKDFLDEIHDLVETTFPNNIQVEWSTDENLRPIFGNTTQLHQVLLNLCVNARDAMPDGGLLRLEARNLTVTETKIVIPAELNPGDYVVLTVADSGTGIPNDVRNRIFEPLFTTKPEGKGTGLGLSIVRQVVNDHRGAIEVASQPGQGSKFIVYLPAVPAPQPTAHKKVSAASEPALSLLRTPEGTSEAINPPSLLAAPVISN